MASLLSSIGQAVYREYDRRVRRASLVTEYGAGHHGHAAHHDAEDEDAGEIANLPRGSDVGEHAPAPVAHIAVPNEDLSLPEASSTPAAPAAPAASDDDDGEDGEIVNAPPGTLLQP